MEHSQKWPGSQHAYSENSLFSSCKAVTKLSIIDFWFRKVLYSMLNFFFIDWFQYGEKYVTGIFTNVWIQSLTLNLKFSLSYQRGNENFWLYIKEKRHVSSPLTVVSWCLVAEFAEIVLNLGVLIRCSSFIIQWVTQFFLLPKKKTNSISKYCVCIKILEKSSYLLY